MIDLRLGDCLEVMKEIPSKSIDAIITDPPYIGIINAKWDKGENPFNEELVKEMFRVLKANGSVYVWCGIGEKSNSLFDFYPILKSKFYFKDLITWKKKKGIGMRKGWLYTREECLWFVKDNKSFFWNKENQYSEEERKTSNKTKCIPKSKFKRITNVWTDISEATVGNLKNKIKLHPCEKPVKLIERIVLTSTKENETVLDMFMGSNSTGLACKNTNRNFIGIEMNDEYYDIACKRVGL